MYVGYVDVVDAAVRCRYDDVTVHAELGVCQDDPHLMVLIGRKHNCDYVRAFNLPPDSPDAVVAVLCELARYVSIGRIDAGSMTAEIRHKISAQCSPRSA